MIGKIIHPIYCLLLICSISALAQDIKSEALLLKAIAYHDPLNSWESFRGSLLITMETPNNSNRYSEVTLDLPAEYFKLVVRKDNTTYEQEVNKGTCTLSLNGSATISAEDAKKYRLSCDRAIMMKNYYTYLYGLPMKLRDKGTILDPAVLKKPFQGKEYLVLKVTYEEKVGKDTWYFYLDPTTYAMEVYQFFHDEAKNDGEYILLDGIEEVRGMKIPKKRSWYTNKENRLLGTDLLTAYKSID